MISPTPIDVQALTRPLQRIARRVGRHFPAHILSTEDLSQQGYLGILRVTPHPDDTPARRLSRHLTAAKFAMIDALRTYSHWPNQRRRLEVLVDDLAALADLTPPEEDPTSAWIRDLQRLQARLSLREQVVLLARIRGDTMCTIATDLHLTEGRVSQLLRGIVAQLTTVEHDSEAP